MTSTSSNTNGLTSTSRWNLYFALLMLQWTFLIRSRVEAFQALPTTNAGLPLTRMPSTLLYQSTPAVDDNPISDFQKRLLDRMNPPGKIRSQNSISRQQGPTNTIQEVRTLKEYKRVVIDEAREDQLVVVWFYSPWCRSCKGVSKGVQALSREYQRDVKFVQVPVLSENAILHQGLGVKSVPFAHVYHPTLGLMEERKLTRKHLPGFHKLLQDYRMGECSLEQRHSGDDDSSNDRWSTESPYEPAPKAKDIEGETVLQGGA